MDIVLLCLVAYILGSLPISIILTRAFQLPDPRKYGSGNIGATNVGRMHKYLGIAVFIADSVKVFCAVYIARICGVSIIAQHLVWAFVILGQTRSLFLQFTGGKGVSCFIAGVIFFYPLWVLPLIGFAGIVYLIFGHVWIVSLVTVCMFSVLTVYYSCYVSVCDLAIAAWVMYLHRTNFIQHFSTCK